jgi:trans-2,3-dihydro-3-hydroxyanthranilate isomerase
MASEAARPEPLEYEVVDVFGSAPFTGNPLAVVYGAEALDTAQLQAIASEFNLSETAFPVPMTSEDEAAGATYRVRIFTPATELPFAGHPPIGTAWALARRGATEPGDGAQACGAGLIDVVAPADPAAPVTLAAFPRDHARRMSDSDAVELAALVGLTAPDLTGVVYSAGCGLTWTYLQVTEGSLSRSRTVGRALSETGVDLSAIRDPVDGVVVFAVTPGADGIAIKMRCFVPGFGVPEDPATGSAAAGLGLVLVAAGLAAADGATSYDIEQGVDMGRPSSLHGRVEAVGGVATRVHVSGRVFPVATGRIRVA